MDHPHYPTFVLQVNINCCKHCPKKLKKLVLKLIGVDSVEVEPEKRLVYVKGKIDPKALIKIIKSKMNKIATLLPDEKSNQAENDKNKDGRRGDGSEEGGYCRSGDNCSGGGGAHKEEAYREQWGYNRIDEEICRDKHCLIHKGNPIMRNGRIFPQRSYEMPPPPQAFGWRMPPPPPPPVPPPFGYGYNVSDFSGEGNTRGGCPIM